MAAAQPNLRVRISADIDDIKQGLALVRAEVGKFRQEAAKSIDLQGLTDGFAQVRNLVGGLFAGVTVGSLFSALITETREASNELAQLEAVLKSTGQQAGFNSQQLLEMAETMATTTTHSAGEIVKAQTRLLSYTGIVGKEFPAALQMAIDQSARLGQNIEQSAETIGKALDKPSQGVTALTLQGFKFTEQQKQQMKVMEATGRTAEAQQIVLDAMAESYAGAAAAMRGTFSGALTALGSSLRELLDGSGSSSLSGATSAINELATALGSPEIKGAFSEMASSVLELVRAFAQFMAQDGIRVLRMLAEAATVCVRQIDLLVVALVGGLVGRGVALAVVAIPKLTAQLATMRATAILAAGASRGLAAALSLIGGPVTLVIAGLTTALYYLIRNTGEAKRAAEEYARVLNQVKELSKTSRDAAFELAQAKRAEAIETLRAAKAHLESEKYEAQATGFNVGGGGPFGGQRVVTGDNDPQVLQAKARMEVAAKGLADIEAALFDIMTSGIEQILKPESEAIEAGATAIAKSNANMVDAVRRSLTELDRLYQDNGISIEEYFAKRVALQQKSIDLEIDQARAELALATDAGGRRRIEEQITKLQRDRADVATVASTEQKKAEDALAKSLGEVKNRLLELDGKAGEAERAQLEEQYRTLMARLRAQGDATGEALVTSLIDRLVAKSKTDEIRDAVSRITSQLQGRESNVSAQVSAGLMGYNEGEQQLSDARANALVQLQALRLASLESMAGLKKGSAEHAAAVDGLRDIDTQISQVVASQQVWGMKIRETAGSAFGDFLVDLTTTTKNFKNAWSDMVKSFIAGVARMMAERAALVAIDALFGSFGRAPAAAGKVSANTKLMSVGRNHSGGKIGASGTRIRIPISPLAVGQAPRFHVGGQHGLKADERLTVLQTGERVLSRPQTAAYDAAMRGTGSVGSVQAGASTLRVEIENKGPPARVESASMEKGPGGETLVKLLLGAAAEDLANGGVIAQAGMARFDWAERV